MWRDEILAAAGEMLEQSEIDGLLDAGRAGSRAEAVALARTVVEALEHP